MSIKYRNYRLNGCERKLAYLCAILRHKVMELFYLIIGFGLGVLGRFLIKDTLSLFKIVFCFGTSFTFIKLFHNDIVMRSPFEWTLYNLLTGYNFWMLGILGFIVSWIFFYYMIPKLLIHLVNKFSKRFYAFYNKLSIVDLSNLEQSTQKLLKWWTFIVYKTSIIHIKPVKTDETNLLDYEGYLKLLAFSIAMSLHIIVVWFTYFSFSQYFIIPIVLILILLIFFLLLSPIYRKYRLYVYQIMTYEFNRNVKQYNNV